MQVQDTRPGYRLRRFWRHDAGAGKYKGSAELLDMASGQRAAGCDLQGSAALLPVAILDAGARTWSMNPNRKVMPSGWTLADPAGVPLWHFEQRILAKVFNPGYRVVLSLRGAEEREHYRLVDPRGTMLDQFFLGPDEWALLQGEAVVAKLALVKVKHAGKPVSGLLGRLGQLLREREEHFISAGGAHLLPAPVVLGMLLLVRELTDPSASG
jgi:hypothetical protein